MEQGERTFKVYELPVAVAGKNGVYYGWFKYLNLCKRLEKEFREYYEKCKLYSPTDSFDDLSGSDFEVYLAGFLKRLGFENITRTPATRDQGADS